MVRSLLLAGVNASLSFDIQGHFLSHALLQRRKRFADAWRSLWLEMVWSIWLMRNDIVFSDAVMDHIQIVGLRFRSGLSQPLIIDAFWISGYMNVHSLI
ncbi:hypothetical protein RIF29_27872 [Crotalaria pallida]|uniref:Uncharacterized protein n=1 Tax=Crotalaria pallida TaxID=3830 RepID=A0AAN9EXA4_CROPI